MSKFIELTLANTDPSESSIIVNTSNISYIKPDGSHSILFLIHPFEKDGKQIYSLDLFESFDKISSKSGIL